MTTIKYLRTEFTLKVFSSIANVFAVLGFAALFAAASVERVSAQTFTFVNSTQINIADNSTATPFYPSNVSVTGVPGRVTKVVVTLNGFTHTRPDDVGVLLVAPSGQKIRLMTDVGGSTAVNSPTNVPIDDRGALFFPDNAALTGVISKPTLGTNNVGNAHAADFPAPAPVGPYSVRLSDLVGIVPNGTWSLYVDDDTAGHVGTINLGWTINITAGGAFTNSNPIVINDLAPASVYPSTVNVAGFTSGITKVTVRLNGFSHTYPDDVGMLLVGPTGTRVRLTTDNGGSIAAANIDVLFDDSAANAMPDSGPLVATSYRPTEGIVFSADPHPSSFPAPAPASPYQATFAAFVGSDPNGVWSLYIDDDTGGDVGTLTGWTLTIESSAPTAAGVDIDGRVVTASGEGIAKARVVLSGGMLGEPVEVLTNRLGYYRFENIESGHTYVVSVGARRYRFSDAVRVVNLSDSLAELDFVAEP
jgi:subtilisin-like proprotein convertase family protein